MTNSIPSPIGPTMPSPWRLALWGLVCMLVVGLGLGGCTTTTTGGGVITTPSSSDAQKRAQVRVELASNYFERGQNDVALEEVKRALDASGDFAPAHNLRGLILGAMGEHGEAEASFRQALALDGRDGFIAHNYGWFLCQQGRYAEAHVQFANALRQPSYRDPIRSLLAQGVCYTREKKYPEAEQALGRAYEMDAGNPTVGYNYADVLYRRQEFERARFLIRRINQNEQLSNAQSLWLAARIEHRMGNRTGVAQLGQQLRTRFPQASETLAYERGRFDD